MHSREEIVHTWSEDGFRLDGVLIQPAEGAPKPIAVVCVPGLYAAFYDAPLVALGRELARRGYACICGNTRGHGFGAVLRRADGSIEPGGGGWERFADSPRDIGGWLDLAAERGFVDVALLGHSLGARKVAAYQAERQDTRVVALIAASPVARDIGPPDPETRALAERMVAEGRGRDLLPWPPYGCSMSAQTYLDHEHPDATARRVFWSDRDTPPVARVRCPLLAFFGAEEQVDDRDRTPELATIQRNAVAAARVDTLLIPSAGHMYEGHEADVAQAIATWLDDHSALRAPV
jgi:alpha-beta hydrolase superfamily lysophospholipase